MESSPWIKILEKSEAEEALNKQESFLLFLDHFPQNPRKLPRISDCLSPRSTLVTSPKIQIAPTRIEFGRSANEETTIRRERSSDNVCVIPSENKHR